MHWVFFLRNVLQMSSKLNSFFIFCTYSCNSAPLDLSFWCLSSHVVINDDEIFEQSHAGDVMEQCGVGHCTLGYFIHRACQFYVVNC